MGLQAAGKLNAENKEKGSKSEDENKEPRQPNTGGQKKSPPLSQNGEHDIRHAHPQKVAEMRTQGALHGRASRLKVQSMVVISDHL